MNQVGKTFVCWKKRRFFIGLQKKWGFFPLAEKSVNWNEVIWNGALVNFHFVTNCHTCKCDDSQINLSLIWVVVWIFIASTPSMYTLPPSMYTLQKNCRIFHAMSKNIWQFAHHKKVDRPKSTRREKKGVSHAIKQL